MDDDGKVETLDNLINNERGSIKWSLIVAIGYFIIGLAASSFIYYISLPAEGSADAAKTQLEAMAKYASAIPVLFGTFFSGFPIKDYFAKKNRITSCQFLQLAFKSPPVPEEIDKRFWTLVDKSLG